jgi:Flp pilus assembly protein TadD
MPRDSLLPQLERRTGRVLDPGAPVFLMENHDQAYRLWSSAGLRDRVLVHIDAHDDLIDHGAVQWTPAQASTNIATFLCAALREGIVREMVWVVPDDFWKPPANSYLIRLLQKITLSYQANPRDIMAGEQFVSTSILDKALRICPLENLPHLGEKVLLDIDVDYFCTADQGKPAPLPWCWPHELLAKLEVRKLHSDLITIAFSVEGGYTPLHWKYLGEELAGCLEHPDDDLHSLHGMGLMRQAALAAARKDFPVAEKQYLEAGLLLPNSAAPLFHLAHLNLELGRVTNAREYYQRALALDPSYRTPYNSAGIGYYARQMFKEAAAEHQKTLLLDPEDPYAHYGLGRLAARRRDWCAAETHLKRSLALDANLVDAHRTLGEVLAKRGCRLEAIAAYEKSLKLTLEGHKTLKGPIVSDPGSHGLLDIEHCRTHAGLARLHALEGEYDRAISGYRLSIGGGYDGVWLRGALAYLYLKRRQWQNVVSELGQAVALVPADLRIGGRRLWHLCRVVLKRALSGLGLPRR